VKLAHACSSVLLALSLAPASLAQSIQKVSLDFAGGPADGDTEALRLGITPDGRYVLCESAATDLVPFDVNNAKDTFVLDTTTGTTRLASFGVGGVVLDRGSLGGSISDDGNRVAFYSSSTNVMPGLTPTPFEVFVTDAASQSVFHASVALGGGISNGYCFSPSISGNGRWVAFWSSASNLVAGDTNGRADIFVRDLVTGTTVLASVTGNGTLGNNTSMQPDISKDGTYVAFASLATNFTQTATNGRWQIYMKNLQSGALILVSRSALGAAADWDCRQPSISGTPLRVAFTSQAGTLVPGVPAGVERVFLRELALGTTTLPARRPDGLPANGTVLGAALSSNGEFLLQTSDSTNLTTGHTGSAYDVFVTQIATGRTLRVSRPLVEPGEPNEAGFAFAGGVSDDGSCASLSTNATNLMPGEPADTIFDAYRATIRLTWYQDLDGDGHGASAVTQLGDWWPTAGWSLEGDDCDDTNPQVRPGAAESCNGVDDNCDGTVDNLAATTYCTAGTSSLGCVPTISASGVPSASAASGFFLQSTFLPGAKNAVGVYGLTTTAVPYATNSSSTICVAAPRQRMTPLATGGSAGQCNGSLSFDWLAYMAANPGALGQPLQAGTTFHAQVWYRDSNAPLASNLTAGVSFTLCP
jgi:hypothetical protein